MPSGKVEIIWVTLDMLREAISLDALSRCKIYDSKFASVFEGHFYAHCTLHGNENGDAIESCRESKTACALDRQGVVRRREGDIAGFSVL